MTSAANLTTLVSLFSHRVDSDGPQAATTTPDGVSRTWQQLAHDVQRFAAVLRQLGVQAGDRVMQISENRYEWIVADLAIHLCRAIHVAAHAVLSAAQIRQQIDETEPRCVILSGQQQAEKLANAGIRLADDVPWVAYNPATASLGRHGPHAYADLISSADDAAGAMLQRDALAQVTPNDLATILYTSGTTGEGKGVMLTHGNLVSNALASLHAFDFKQEDVRLCWLPLSHIFARTCDLYIWIANGSQLALAESRETILRDCARMRPTVINGVPYFYDKVMRHLIAQGEADLPGRLQNLLGGRMRLCVAGGAALNDAVADFYWQRGVPLCQGYGLTESSPVIATGTTRANKIGSVGRAIEGVEVRIAGDGEIPTFGPHVMRGYWKNETATAEVLRDGWLYTGDLGRLDDDDYLFITGRKKELIVTAAGKNVAPAHLESLLTQDEFILQAVAVGDNRKYLTALLVPNPDALRALVMQQQLCVTSPAEALAHPLVQAMYRQRIDQRLACVSDCEQVRRFTLLDRGFTIEHEELTPTLKPRRTVIERHFAEHIAGMYAD